VASGASSRPPRPRRRERNVVAERILAEQLALTIGQHRQTGRAALLAGELDIAFDELCAARQIESDLDRLSASARSFLPADWELETDLTPLARALSARAHARAADAWRKVLEDRPARSIQAEAAEWLANAALASGPSRAGLRMLHAASMLGRRTDPVAFTARYGDAGLHAASSFAFYLAACRVDPGTARATGLRDPLTNQPWADQDARWWSHVGGELCETDHQAEALGRARDLASTKREIGWLMIAEGDYAAGSRGPRTLGRNVRTGCADPADEDAFVRIRLAYEGAAERLPDVAWPWYRLAELLAWAGFGDRAAEHLAQAEQRGLGNRDVERSDRSVLRALVHAGLGHGVDGVSTMSRPFPATPYAPPLTWRLWKTGKS
jgi:hypothetical protein